MSGLITENGSIEIGTLNVAFNYITRSKNTIIFIHGNSAAKDVFEGQLKFFSEKGYSVLSIDLPGHGESSNSHDPEVDYNFPAFALLVKKVQDALGITSPLIVGWSLGGHIAIEMAGRGFDLSGAMIFGTPPIGPGLDDFESAFIPSAAMAVTLKEDRSEEDVKTYVSGLYGSLTPLPDTYLDLAARTDPAMGAHVGAHWSSGEQGCHQKTVVAGWQKPFCVIHGDQDAFASQAFIQNVRWGNLWQEKVIVMEGVGHAPFIEVPEKFNEILSEFANNVFSGRSV
ncbi:alpha/beta fold hydrolase [Hellea balneolensis]|uniref:alpha/beta fold hydrolase n=1 Tax=Hellea balneolensis TaxID=287478 RepID=UPI00041E5488|nr:alpha/beta hydrolase [Hellea balneolensis]